MQSDFFGLTRCMQTPCGHTAALSVTTKYIRTKAQGRCVYGLNNALVAPSGATYEEAEWKRFHATSLEQADAYSYLELARLVAGWRWVDEHNARYAAQLHNDDDDDNDLGPDDLYVHACPHGQPCTSVELHDAHGGWWRIDSVAIQRQPLARFTTVRYDALFARVSATNTDAHLLRVVQRSNASAYRQLWQALARARSRG